MVGSSVAFNRLDQVFFLPPPILGGCLVCRYLGYGGESGKVGILDVLFVGRVVCRWWRDLGVSGVWFLGGVGVGFGVNWWWVVLDLQWWMLRRVEQEWHCQVM